MGQPLYTHGAPGSGASVMTITDIWCAIYLFTDSVRPLALRCASYLWVKEYIVLVSMPFTNIEK